MRFLLIAFSTALTFGFAASASAQTAGSYCASISGCEVISINMNAQAYDTNQYVMSGAGSIEYCRGNHYKVQPFYFHQRSAGNSYQSQIIIMEQNTSSTIALNYTNKALDGTTLCTTISTGGSGLNVLP